MVVFDTARVDRFGAYGYGRATTPTVDGLARDGLRVETMVANGPWTMPSHGSLFTGLYPTQHGSQWQTGPRLRDRVQVTLAGWMRGLGYETICVTNNGLISDKTRLSEGFDRYAFRMDLERGRRRVSRRLKKVLLGGDSGGRVTNDWIRQQLPDVRRPMFLFVNYLECHWAYAPPRRFERRVGGTRFGYVEGARYRATRARTTGPWEAIARADERTLQIYSSLYDGELANVDDHLRELIDILREAGRFRESETLLMVTSDHGEHVGEHGLADHHASLDEHLTHVPFVAYGPGIVQPRVEPSLFELVDVFPSIANLLGREIPVAELQARRSGLLTDGAQPHEGADGVAFTEWRSWNDKERARLARRNPAYDFSGLAHDLVSARTKRFKLVRSSDGSEALYDLETDPAETRDVREVWPDETRRLRDRLQSAVMDWTTWEGDAGEISDAEKQEIEQRLEELGYI